MAASRRRIREIGMPAFSGEVSPRRIERTGRFWRLMPNRPRGFGNDPYFVRRHRDYLVKYLFGVDLPEGHKIGRN